MKIFDNGKYKSLYAGSQSEWQDLMITVSQDHDYRPAYHICPPVGLLNDPNGLIFDGKNYHIFYQWYPFGAIHGMKHWAHLMTENFQSYHYADPLIPSEDFESHGCYSGGAILINEKIYAFYTGNTRRKSDNQRVPFQNLAIFNLDGSLQSKHVLLASAPEGYSEHVRDPSPFFYQGKLCFIIGAQNNHLSGTALWYEIDINTLKTTLKGELHLNDFPNDHVFMWECPNLFKLDQSDVFIFSPQGKIRESEQYQNNYHAIYALGTLKENIFNLQYYAELDQGFDFYAPQSIQGLHLIEGKGEQDKPQKAVIYAWCGLPDLQYPTDSHQWHSTLTLPRELWIENKKLHQFPLQSMLPKTFSELSTQPAQVANIPNLDTSWIQIKNILIPFELALFTNSAKQTLTLSYHEGTFCLDRSETEQTPSMKNLGEQRYCKIETLHQIDIFLDKSVIEIYLNGGEKALTSRFFIPNRQNVIYSQQALSLNYAKIPHIEYHNIKQLTDALEND